MAEQPAYAILGGGYWGGRMRAILGETREVVLLEGARRKQAESDSSYRSRLSGSFEKSGAQIAWLCVPPGAHVPGMVEAAIEAGLHVIVEKPWLNSRAETKPLQELAARGKLLVGLHYQYCLLEAVEAWKHSFNDGAGLEFGGRFTTSRSNRIGIDSLDILGSHLVAIRECSVPKAKVSEIRCGYEMDNERRVWLRRETATLSSIDFVVNHEPVIQRFITRVEAGIEGAPFPFQLDFALRVAEATAKMRQQKPRPRHSPDISGPR